MLRVKLNLWADSVQGNAEVHDEAERHGDWLDEQERVDARLTREDLCKTFQEKFPVCREPEIKNIA
jgi:hypothetical protein